MALKRTAAIRRWVRRWVWLSSRNGSVRLSAGMAAAWLFALANCWLLGIAIWLGGLDRAWSTGFGLTCFLIALSCYVSGVLVMHLIAACDLPLTARIVMVYGSAFAFCTAASWAFADSITPSAILAASSLSAAGFVQRWLRGWRAVGSESFRGGRLGIFTMLDVTAAIALTFALIGLEGDNVNVQKTVNICLTSVVFAVVGMHVWYRLASLCPTRRDAETASGLWLVINIMFSLFVFLMCAIVNSSTPVGLTGFIVAPAALALCHFSTELPLRWLRACGWRLVRRSASENAQPVEALHSSTCSFKVHTS